MDRAAERMARWRRVGRVRRRVRRGEGHMASGAVGTPRRWGVGGGGVGGGGGGYAPGAAAAVRHPSREGDTTKSGRSACCDSTHARRRPHLAPSRILVAAVVVAAAEAARPHPSRGGDAMRFGWSACCGTHARRRSAPRAKSRILAAAEAAAAERSTKRVLYPKRRQEGAGIRLARPSGVPRSQTSGGARASSIVALPRRRPPSAAGVAARPPRPWRRALPRRLVGLLVVVVGAPVGRLHLAPGGGGGAGAGSGSGAGAGASMAAGRVQEVSRVSWL